MKREDEFGEADDSPEEKHDDLFDEDDAEESEDDLFDDSEEDLPDIDRQIRINELKERARELAGGDMVEGGTGEPLDPAVEEEFWKQVIAFEEGEWSAPFDKLEKAGVDLPDPDDLDETQLSEKLAELIGAMASLRMFLLHTDHLSDRELYEMLWHETLREEGPDMPQSEDAAWMFDLVSSGSEEDNHAYLKYYAPEDYRQEWARDFPEDQIPPHEDLPFDRDRNLPQP